MYCRSIAFTVFLVTLSSARAQPLRIEIQDIQVGFRAGMAQEIRCKSGAWAPLIVHVISPRDVPANQAVLIVETYDSDGVQNRFPTPLPALERDKRTPLMTYVRPGNTNPEMTVIIRDLDGRELDRDKPRGQSQYPQNPSTILYLVAGSRLPPLKRVILEQGRVGVPDEDIFDQGSHRFGYADNVEELPTRWFGYQAVDVMVLTTGSKTFIDLLTDDQNLRKEALAEWVRRGGRLVLSVGHNHQRVSEMLEKIEKRTGVKLIDCKIEGTVQRRHLMLHELDRRQRPLAPLPDAGIEVARLAPGKGVDVLASERDFPLQGEAPRKVDEEVRPLVIQAPCGLGRVILVACDIDQAPFTQWGGQADFYQWLRQELEPRPGRGINEQPMAGGGRVWGDGSSGELASSLQESLESFDDIPVVSFGWVALFIFLYILVVGPLDYLFLKKVVKRLELTWITFPVVVIVVSTLAYYTAYALKGNDLKINKFDLVDIDLHGARAYGSTWFTLFSPRIQNYTVGIEPAYPGWAQAPAADGGRHSTLVDWMGRPDHGYRGTARSGGGGLFKRAYTYEPDAAGLDGVPIQVWASKSFTASWEAPLPSDRPLFQADLKHPPGRPEDASVRIIGTITSHLPVELEDVILLYRDKAYTVDRLSPGVPWRIVDQDRGSMKMEDWLQKPLPDMHHRVHRTHRYSSGPMMEWSPGGQTDLVKSILFYRKAELQAGADNATLRYLDQSWRLDPRRKDEVIVFGRTAPKPADAAEQVTQDGVSPSRLWLGQVPGKGKRDSLAGTLLQRTYVRVFIPVAPK